MTHGGLLHACARAAVLLALVPWQGTAGAATVQVRVEDPAGRPVPGAVVFVESPDTPARLRAPLPTLEIEQVGKRFVPQVLVVPVGTPVSFPNRDTVRHHVYSFSPAKTFEIKLYVGTPAAPVVFDRSGVVVLGCNIHDTMIGWVVVVPTPYHARADEQGVARIDGVPPGQYRLRAWHAGLGVTPSDQTLTVSSSGTTVTARVVATP